MCGSRVSRSCEFVYDAVTLFDYFYSAVNPILNVAIVQNAKLLRKCTMLEKNLSCLYKTAWAHLRRKDEYIEALKHQIKAFRKLTGMVTPGVPLDANLADAIDGNPADASEEPHSKCESTEQCSTYILGDKYFLYLNLFISMHCATMPQRGLQCKTRLPCAGGNVRKLADLLETSNALIK